MLGFQQKSFVNFQRNWNLDKILSLFCQNFDVSIFRNFDFYIEIGISIAIVYFQQNQNSD
jgi:hypothetical protein